ncbi:hypothetical protein ACLOJK_012212 [Asimina triloba]
MSTIHEALGVDAAKEVVSFSSPFAKEPSELGGVEELAGHHSSHLLPLVARRGGGNSEVSPACILRSGAIATGLVVNMASCFFKNSQAILGHADASISSIMFRIHRKKAAGLFQEMSNRVASMRVGPAGILLRLGLGFARQRLRRKRKREGRTDGFDRRHVLLQTTKCAFERETEGLMTGQLEEASIFTLEVELDRALKELQGRTPPTLSMNEAKAQRLELDFAKAEIKVEAEMIWQVNVAHGAEVEARVEDVEVYQRLEVVETEWRKLCNQLQALERVLGDFEAAWFHAMEAKDRSKKFKASLKDQQKKVRL